MENTSNLQDFQINVKFKLSALWASVMFCYIYGDYFSLFVPGRLKGLLDGNSGVGETTPITLVMFSLLMAIPASMIFLSLTLKPTINRISNIVLSLIYTAIMALIVITSKNPWMLFNTVLGSIEMILTLTIFFYAAAWPKDPLQSIVDQQAHLD